MSAATAEGGAHFTITAEVLAVVEEVTRRVARTFKRRVSYADVNELQQAAWVAVLGRLRAGGYNPAAGDLGGYVWGTAYRAAAIELTRASSPVSAHHRREVLRNTRGVSDEVLEWERDDSDPEAATARALLLAKIRARATEVVGPKGAAFYIDLVDGKVTAGEYAAQCKVSTRDVREGAARVREALSDDPTLFELWKELTE